MTGFEWIGDFSTEDYENRGKTLLSIFLSDVYT